MDATLQTQEGNIRQFRNRKVLKCITLAILSLLLTLGALEIVLRVMHIATDVPWVEGHPMLGFKYLPNQTGTWVVGRFGDEKTRYHINSDGWNATRDFSEKRDPGTVRIAVIGDSYIEALNVPPEASIAALLESHLSHRDKVEVYPFGVSGASLSHYLALMRYVRTRFSPDFYIVNIVHNDFEDSLPRVDRPVFHAVRRAGDSYEEVPPKEYHPILSRRIIGHLAIVRYLHVNLKLNGFGQLHNLRHDQQHQQFEANIDVSTIDVRDMRGLVKYLLGKYLQEVDGDYKRLMLMIDTSREPIYEGTHPQTSSAFQYNKLTAEVCHELSLHYLDLTDPFWQDFQQHKRRFNSVLDGHWDAYGHEVAAKAIENFLLSNAFLPSKKAGMDSH
jgi:hypothetical protein